MPTNSQVVIVGGGIVGCCTAYYLSLKGVRCTLVDEVGIASAASGKAGGFLAKDWSDSTPLGPLARRGFELHELLSRSFLHCGYKRVRVHDVLFTSTSSSSPQKKQSPPHEGNIKNVPKWVHYESVERSGVLGDERNSMQVCPHLICNALWEYAVSKVGSKLVIAKVVGIETAVVDASSTPEAVALRQVILQSGERLSCTDVVCCMGPWTLSPLVASWFPGLPTCNSPRAHSILIDERVSNDALFVEFQTDQLVHSYEVYSRSDGVYICGDSDFYTLPDNSSLVKTEPKRIEQLRNCLNEMCPSLKDKPILKEQCCYLPASPDGYPIIGPVPGFRGAYIATGTTCWGILCGPSTGKAIADLITQGECTSISLEPYSLERCFGQSKV